jgi:hypothetical protein
VLTPEESSDWRARLAQRWGVQADSWHPMLAAPVPEDVLVLTEDSMWDGPGIDLVRQALTAKGGRRVAQLREYGVDHLLDVQLVAPRYTGAEGVWSEHTLDWIAFASHEGPVAFGGTLLKRPCGGQWKQGPGRGSRACHPTAVDIVIILPSVTLVAPADDDLHHGRASFGEHRAWQCG